MNTKKNLLALTSLIITLILSGCSSTPSHLIIAPEIIVPAITQHNDKKSTLNVVDMRTANHIIQILREGKAATIFSAQDRLEDIIKNSLSKNWKQQGLTLQSNAANSINVTIEKALISVAQQTMSYQVKTEVVLKVAVNNGIQTLTSTFKNNGSSKGPFKADLAVLERNFNQRLANLLQQILVNEKVNSFLK
jgi:uncharacterized lipoprotein